MRLLAYNTRNKIIDKLEIDEYYIVDKTEDLDDTLYHLQVRFYNMVILHENNLKNCLKILQSNSNSTTAFVILTTTDDKKFHLKCFKSGALCVINTP